MYQGGPDDDVARVDAPRPIAATLTVPAVTVPAVAAPGRPSAAVTDQQTELERLQTIFHSAPVGIGIVHPAGHLLMANETLRLLLGYSAEEFADMPWPAYTHPDDVAENLELNRQMAAGEIDSFTLQKRFICKDGRELWAELTSAMVRNDDGSPDYLIGMVQDISDRKQLERELRAAEGEYRELVERVPAVVYMADAGDDGRWHYVSRQIQDLLGFTPEEWTADTGLWLRHIHPDDRAIAVAADQPRLTGAVQPTNQSTSYRMLHRDGTVVWVRDDALAVLDGDRVTWHGMLVDITREKHLEERLAHQAFHDSLTGLPNRALFHQRVDRALDRAGSRVAVLIVDLDEFKTVNDSFGHAYGDRLIRTAADRIGECVEDGTSAARLGGDEFALLVERADDAEVEELAGRVLHRLRGLPMRLGDLTVTVGASIGIAVSAPGDTTDTLLRNADLAMYEAKAAGRDRFVRYRDSLHEEVVQRFRIEEALQAAVAQQQVTLAYQPIVDIDTGAVVGLEALARWTDPQLGVVPPSEFIPVAERTGLIRDLGGQLIRRACADLAGWRADTGVDAYVSVNVSPRQLDDEFADTVDRVLRDTGLPSSALLIEVTEGLLLAESGRAAIRELRDRGIRVAIDDFGTGYSSLAYLRELPVDMIKVDQVFLRPGRTGPHDHALLVALFGLAESLRLTTVFEGVETVDHLRLLDTIGCRYAQGYLFGRPGPLHAVPPAVDPAVKRGRVRGSLHHFE